VQLHVINSAGIVFGVAARVDASYSSIFLENSVVIFYALVESLSADASSLILGSYLQIVSSGVINGTVEMNNAELIASGVVDITTCNFTNVYLSLELFHPLAKGATLRCNSLVNATTSFAGITIQKGNLILPVENWVVVPIFVAEYSSFITSNLVITQNLDLHSYKSSDYNATLTVDGWLNLTESSVITVSVRSNTAVLPLNVSSTLFIAAGAVLYYDYDFAPSSGNRYVVATVSELLVGFFGEYKSEGVSMHLGVQYQNNSEIRLYFEALPDHSLHWWAYLLIAVGAVCAVGIVGVVGYKIWRKRKAEYSKVPQAVEE